jgi:hypothetical protein
LLKSMLLNFHRFVEFPISFLLFISSFIPLWMEKKLYMTSIFLNLSRLLLWPDMVFPKEYSIFTWEECVFCCCLVECSVCVC